MGFMAFAAANFRWLFAGFLLTLSSSFGQTYFISLFAGEIRAEYGLSHGAFGSLYMMATLASAATLLWLGKLADHRRLDLVAGFVIAGLAAASLGMALARDMLLLVTVLYGLRLFGQGMLTHLSLTAMARWYNQQRGRAVSIAGLGIPAGEAVLPAIAVVLMAAVGWRETWMASFAVLMFVACPFAILLLRQSRKPRGHAVADGSDRPVTNDWPRSRVLRDPLFYALLPGLMSPSFMVTGVFFHQVYLVEVKGWDLSLFAAGYSFYAAATVVAGLVAGWVIDRWSAVRVLPTYLVPMGLGLAVLAWTQTPVMAMAFFVLTGLTAGGGSSVLGALWAELYGTAHIGAIRSVAVSAMVLSSALAPGLMGWLIDIGVGIEWQLAAMSAYTLAAAIVFAMMTGVLERRSASLVLHGAA